jgi:hypothetical protein
MLPQAFRICATCRNLDVLEEGREFEKIADSAYVVFSCKVLGWKTREDYLMAPVPTSLPGSAETFECPHWEMHTSPIP